jgi:hypothetical protein
MFQKYGIDLVISSHNQYYERSYPILYNEESEKDASKKDKPKPIIATYEKNVYPSSTDGIIFLTVGTAGDKLDKIKEKHDYYVVQESEFGFLYIKLKDNGKILRGEFHTNDGKILDHFELNDNNSDNKKIV